MEASGAQRARCGERNALDAFHTAAPHFSSKHIAPTVEPEYPLIAQHAQIQGLVILEATVDRNGRVNEVRVLRSHSFLNDAAVVAVRQWRYEPLMLNGEPQPFVLAVTVSFSIPGSR
jgi:protein TonB